MFKKAAMLAIGLAVALSAETVVKGVKIRFNRSERDRRLVDKSVDLTFDDTARRLIAKGFEKEVTIAYDDVRKVVFDVATHMRGGAVGELVDLAPFAGAIAGPMIQARHVNDYWFYIEPKSGPYTVLEVPKESSPLVIDKVKAVFGDKVSEYPTRQGAKIEKGALKDLQSKHSLRDDKKQHPIPELKPDKALVVVVCPPLAARDSGHGNQYKLHANDKVVAVNKPGTYSFAHHRSRQRLLLPRKHFHGRFQIAHRSVATKQGNRAARNERGSYADWKRK